MSESEKEKEGEGRRRKRRSGRRRTAAMDGEEERPLFEGSGGIAWIFLVFGAKFDRVFFVCGVCGGGMAEGRRWVDRVELLRLGDRERRKPGGILEIVTAPTDRHSKRVECRCPLFSLSLSLL